MLEYAFLFRFFDLVLRNIFFLRFLFSLLKMSSVSYTYCLVGITSCLNLLHCNLKKKKKKIQIQIQNYPKDNFNQKIIFQKIKNGLTYDAYFCLMHHNLSWKMISKYFPMNDKFSLDQQIMNMCIVSSEQKLMHVP